MSVADSAGLSGWHATRPDLERETVENDHGRYVHFYRENKASASGLDPEAVHPPHRTAQKLKHLAGSERGAGTFVNNKLAEAAATELRECL